MIMSDAFWICCADLHPVILAKLNCRRPDAPCHAMNKEYNSSSAVVVCMQAPDTFGLSIDYSQDGFVLSKLRPG